MADTGGSSGSYRRAAARGGTAVLDFERPVVELEAKIDELVEFARSSGTDLTAQIEELRLRAADLVRETYSNLSPWQRVQLARHPLRPGFAHYREALFEDWIELHGDRAFGDDRAIVTGLARFAGRRVMVVAHQKGSSTRERLECNFGMPHPEGYRKALRKMRLAEKLGLPVLTFIDTAGAYPGVGAEERGQAFAIAENLRAMSALRVPVVCVVLAEGGSGGALGIGVGDRVLMLENAYYSVISPEGCAAILWKTAERAPDAAAILKITADDLLHHGVIDAIVPEPAGGAHRDPERASGLLGAALERALAELDSFDTDTLLAGRYEKLRRIGAWLERPVEPAGAADSARSPQRRSSERPARASTLSSR
ncbi:MAG: acetyl-CoA carboxylase carboxyltransferase subunit alpha [Planctomycetota bacterium]|nr:MAG: acetyl-CoA carboxylase carboxyltransferase subunit alpha [Planctomycetota bacterium]